MSQNCTDLCTISSQRYGFQNKMWQACSWNSIFKYRPIMELVSCHLNISQSWMLLQPNPMQVSFHLPLHRYFAVFVSQAVQNQGQDLAELLPSNEFLQMALIHPLQLQVGRLACLLLWFTGNLIFMNSMVFNYLSNNSFLN